MYNTSVTLACFVTVDTQCPRSILMHSADLKLWLGGQLEKYQFRGQDDANGSLVFTSCQCS